jgi:hypothetical protein
MHLDLTPGQKVVLYEIIVEALARSAVEKGKTVSYRGAVAFAEGLIAGLQLAPGAQLTVIRDEQA